MLKNLNMKILLILSSGIFCLGICGIFVSRKHILVILFSFELLVLAVVIIFVGSSILLDDLLGQLYALLILTVAASESALGLALTIAFYRLKGSISVDLINLLKA
jgi:NADH-quinone oxidoreductase subunit K